MKAAGYDATRAQAGDYYSGVKALKAADSLEPAIVNTINQNGLNKTPISAITNLKQWFSGQTSDPAQQQLSAQIASYLQQLGISPDQAAAIASQKGGTIGTLLNTLRSNFETANNANAHAGSTSTSSGGSTSGNTYKSSSGNSYNLPY